MYNQDKILQYFPHERDSVISEQHFQYENFQMTVDECGLYKVTTISVTVIWDIICNNESLQFSLFLEYK